MTRPHPIVVAYSMSAGGTQALEHAVEIARRSPGRVLHIVHAIDSRTGSPIIPVDGRPDYRYAEAVQTAISEIVTTMLIARPSPHAVHFDVHARFGRPADEILQLAREVGAELILVGSHDRTGLERMLMGSTSAAVVRGASCSVLIARGTRYDPVDLVDIVPDDHPHPHYTPPHRYTYRDDIVVQRPADWPLY